METFSGSGYGRVKFFEFVIEYLRWDGWIKYILNVGYAIIRYLLLVRREQKLRLYSSRLDWAHSCPPIKVWRARNFKLVNGTKAGDVDYWSWATTPPRSIISFSSACSIYVLYSHNCLIFCFAIQKKKIRDVASVNINTPRWNFTTKQCIVFSNTAP